MLVHKLLNILVQITQMFGAESYVVLKIYGASQTNISSHQAFGGKSMDVQEY